MPTSNDEYASLYRNLRRTAIAAVCIVGFILVTGLYVRYAQSRERISWTSGEDIPTVSLVLPSRKAGQQKLILPGNLQAFYDAQIYSRVPGYVKGWYQDIGAKVRKGDLLATIDTPELDQQINQAEADFGAAISAQKLSRTTAQRWESLLPLDAVSKQDTEEKKEDFAAKTGLVKASQANLDRLQAMKGFARIIAPFDGVVTKRTTDIGALVNPGPATDAEPLFAVADIHRIRVYVQVPQIYSSQIVPGMKASLTVPEYPRSTFQATLVSTSNAISGQSGTLLVELQVNNQDGKLKPGAYAQVSFDLPRSAGALYIPSSALMFRAPGLQVATVGYNRHIVMKFINIDRDLGTEVEVASGLGAEDRIVDNPPDSLANGDLVRIASGQGANGN